MPSISLTLLIALVLSQLLPVKSGEFNLQNQFVSAACSVKRCKETNGAFS